MLVFLCVWHCRATVCCWEMSWSYCMLCCPVSLTTAAQNSASLMVCGTKRWSKSVNCGDS